MKAVGYRKSLPIMDPDALVALELPKPVAGGRDLLVRVEAISVNPVDTKIRRGVTPEGDDYKVLGWDAAGVVEAVGDEVESFKPGDRVWYAGAIDRPGANAEYHLVDARIVGKMPESLGFKEAAAMPLTAITAWEMLFDRFGFARESKGSLLIVGGAGGVGSIMIQLAKKLSNLRVVATASRPETREWVRSMGADDVIDHHQPFRSELARIGLSDVDAIASLTNTGDHLADLVDVIAPQGMVAVIDDPDTLDVMPFKAKSVSLHWELMFTRSLFHTADMGEQGWLLTEVASMVDEGSLKSTIANDFGVINAENLIRAHALLESGKSMGKIVLSGFE